MAHPNGHPYDSSLLVTEKLPPQVPGGNPVDTHRVVKWMNKEDERLYYKNRVNAGIEIISPLLLQETMKHFVPRHPEIPDKIDLDRDVLKPNIPTGKLYAYDTPEYIKDMGTFLRSADDFELLPGAAEAVKMINKSGYLAIVVTNQPVIARGECSWEELQKIHNKMETELGKEGAFLDGIYVCPHHKDKGFEGERPEYKFDCDCRKPKAGLFLQAAKDFNIDLSQSIMIGDSDRDVEAGKNAGCMTSIKVLENEGNTLLNTVKRIIS